MNPKPRCDNTALRTCGGHVHIGYPLELEEDPKFDLRLIQSMDLHLGIAASQIDPDITRRKLYGKAGCFRKPDTGRMEYRVLSNFWLRHPDYIRWVYEQTQAAINWACDKSNYALLDQFKDRIINIINANDSDAYQSLTKDFAIRVPRHA
jgi:hypothetical protein